MQADNLVPNLVKKLKLPKNAMVADLGCGDGHDVLALQKMGYKSAYGFDLKPTKFKNFVKKDFFHLSGQWDLLLVLCATNNYHQIAVSLLLEKLKKNLNAKGYLYLVVPTKTSKDYKKAVKFFKLLEQKTFRVEDNHPPLGKHRHFLTSFLLQNI